MGFLKKRLNNLWNNGFLNCRYNVGYVKEKFWYEMVSLYIVNVYVFYL